MKIKERIFILSLNLLLILALVAPAATTQKEPYRIGAVVCVTGFNAPLGTPERDTLKMLEEQINKAGGIDGHPLEVIIEDDASEPTNSVKAAKKLIEHDKVLALIGSSGTGQTLAMVPITEGAKVPHICLAAGIPITSPIKRWVFRTPQTDVLAIAKIIDYLKKERISKVAMLYDATAFGKSGLEQLEKQAPPAGIEIVAKESFGPKDTDMTVQLTKIKGSDAQAVICWGTNPGPAIIAKNMRQLGMQIPLIQSHGIANKKFIELGGEAVNGVVFPAGKLIVAEALPDSDPQKAVLLKYTKDFREKYGRDADTFGGHAWDALYLIVNALKKVGPDKEKIREEIEYTHNFIGIGGVFNYSPTDHDGLTKEAFVMVKIVEGKWTLLK